jgi:DeoR/GlpR family transcriptional regulator of sugar metabolism
VRIGSTDADALHARRLVEDGTTVFVDASSTERSPARARAARATLVTNSPAIALGVTAESIRDRRSGRAQPAHARADRALDRRFLYQLNVATAFISAAGSRWSTG